MGKLNNDPLPNPPHKGEGTIEDLYQKLEVLIVPLLAQADVELIELIVGGRKNDIALQVIADKITGRITMGECASLNRIIVDAINQQVMLNPESYSLEFSSPGLDRPLKNQKDFKRHLNAAVHFVVNEAVEKKKEFQGHVIDVDAHQVTVALQNKKKQQVVIGFEQIIKAVLVI